MLYINPKENESQNTENIYPIGKQHFEKNYSTPIFFKNVNRDELQNIRNKGKNNVLNHDEKHIKNAFEELIDYIPEYQYDIHVKRTKNSKKKKDKDTFNPVPFDQLETNNNRFYNYNEAFLYVGKHCKKYHGKFTREYCKYYLKRCFIVDFTQDGFIPITNNLSQKQFNKYFFYTQRELKYI